MKSTGNVRKLDMLGRIVIPKYIRNEMQLNYGSEVEVSFNGNYIKINKKRDSNIETRKIDVLGRIVIPSSIRKLLNIKEYDLVEILIDEDTLLLKTFQLKCLICLEEEDLINFNGTKICSKCISEIKRL